ncbi:MAG: hypothetical protein WCC84_07035 [Candidatus Cybelea sp.]
MRIYRAFIAVAVLAAALPSYALAQVESTPIPNPGKPNFSPMQFMIGTWSCSIKSARRPAAYTLTATYAVDPGGWWINQTTVTNPMKWFATQTKLTSYDRITYDATTHRWVDVLYDNQGGYGLSFAKGWNANKIVWHDVSFAPTSDISGQTDTAVTKVSDTKMTSSSSFTEAKTGRVISVTGICTKH